MLTATHNFVARRRLHRQLDPKIYCEGRLYLATDRQSLKYNPVKASVLVGQPLPKLQKHYFYSHCYMHDISHVCLHGLFDTTKCIFKYRNIEVYHWM